MNTPIPKQPLHTSDTIEQQAAARARVQQRLASMQHGSASNAQRALIQDWKESTFRASASLPKTA